MLSSTQRLTHYFSKDGLELLQAGRSRVVFDEQKMYRDSLQSCAELDTVKKIHEEQALVI
jgi:hypothetical protein